MRLCQCGGKLTQYDMTRNRESWRCDSCGRYGIIDRAKITLDDSGEIWHNAVQANTPIFMTRFAPGEVSKLNA